MHPLGLGVLIRVFQGEYTVGDDAELNTALPLYTPLERLLFRVKRKLIFVEKSDAVMFSAGKFKGDHHVGNQKRVFKENPANATVLLAPRYFTKIYV
jgi:hypothetical protein